MFAEWYFHRSLTTDTEMVLAISDLGIAELYSKLSGDDLHNEFFPTIKAEFELTQDLILKYSDHETLLGRRPHPAACNHAQKPLRRSNELDAS